MKNNVLFSELNVEKIKNYLIVLDIDGTVVCDGHSALSEEAVKKIGELKKNNKLYFCSNSRDQKRNNEIAELAGVLSVDFCGRKPRKKSLQNIENKGNLPILIVGDKFLTDGLLAKNIGADFIKVKRLNGKESLLNNFIYFIDDLADKIAPYIFVLRPFHWIKNLLVFTPVFFAKEIFVFDKALLSLYVFLVFCLSASAAYIVNDLVDKNRDKLHNKKRFRPIASGRIGTKKAIAIFLFLAAAVFYVLRFFIPWAFPVIAVYFVLNFIYSFFLKNIAVFDILTVSFFYLLRVLAGGMGADIFISNWLILCVVFVSLFMVAGKRKIEFAREKNKREVLFHYNKFVLDAILNVSAGLAIMSYSLYSVLGGLPDLAVYSVFFVLLGIFRYLFVVYEAREEAEFPEKIIFSDKIILSDFLVWLIFMYFVFY